MNYLTIASKKSIPHINVNSYKYLLKISAIAVILVIGLFATSCSGLMDSFNLLLPTTVGDPNPDNPTHDTPVQTQVKTPVFSITSGSIIASGSVVTFSCETEGAILQYSTDGDSFVEGTGYTVVTPVKLRVKAVKTGLTDSPLATASYIVLPTELEDKTFPIGVWMQASEKIFEGKTVAQHYKDVGVNTYMGLWKWPTEDWAYSGYSLNVAQALKDAGLKAYAGEDQLAVDWINAHPEYQDTIVGYLLGDEPDMKRSSGVAAESAANTPLAWQARGDALRALDDERPIWANFGKPFAKDVWYGSEPGSTGSKASDFAHYVSPTTFLSVDLYGITDPWEATTNHGIWVYGRAITNTLKYAEGRPVYGNVEASAPFKFAADDPAANWMYQRMPPALVKPIIWNMLVHGAQGIIYFCHDFSPVSATNLGSYAALREPGMREAMKEANDSIMAFGGVLRSPDVSGTSVSTDGAVPVVALTKRFNNMCTYVFAMGDGNSSNINGQAVNAVITVGGQTASKTVQEITDIRDVQMVNGKITDHFDPYELHIYKIEG